MILWLLEIWTFSRIAKGLATPAHVVQGSPLTVARVGARGSQHPMVLCVEVASYGVTHRVQMGPGPQCSDDAL